MSSEERRFYSSFCHNFGFNDDNKEYVETLKRDYFSTKLKNNKIYKYISFDDNYELNNAKIRSFNNGELWFGAHYTFEDDSELQINVNPYKVARLTNTSVPYVVSLTNTIVSFMPSLNFVSGNQPNSL